MMNKLSLSAKSWLQRLGAGLALVVAIFSGLALSAFFFGFFLIIAVLLAVWLGWKRWQFKRKYRTNTAHSRHQNADQVIIQGDYKVVREDYIVHQDQDQGQDQQHPPR